MEKQKRNQTIDLLRVIGIILTIAAHASFPDFFFQIREFDVVLLVFVSGYSYAITSDHRPQGWFSYVLHRFRRMILPVWIFLGLFFLVFNGLFHYGFSTKEVIESFCLLSGGIMFVWVFRIFFVNALINPILKKASDHMNLVSLTVITALAGFANDALFRLAFDNGSTIGKMAEYLITYTIGYGLISLNGIYAQRMTRKEKGIAAVIYAVLFVIMACILKLPDFTQYKYPPQMYYISYGLMWSLLLDALGQNIHFGERAGNIIAWLSENCMTIYLWHIVFYYLLMDDGILAIHAQGFAFFLPLLAGSIFCTYLQRLIQRRIRG